MIHHGQLYQRDEVTPRSKYHNSGKFGRLFPTLPAFARDTETVRTNLSELGKAGGLMDATDAGGGPNPNNPDNPKILAGFTFFGQFLDHDITFDPTSSLERQVDPESITNFRTPAFELDSVYGSGRGASPHLYDTSSRGATKLLIDAAAPRDLPRNSQNTALVGDPRNDENLIVSQLHLAFLKFHNAVVDHVQAGGVTDPNDAFDEAQRLVRWHYQWMIVHEFLPTTVGKELVDNVLNNGRKFYKWKNEPFIPVEFSVAAYRFGHSQVRPGYRVNQGFAAGIFARDPGPNPDDPNDLSGGKRADRRFVEWPFFFNLGGNAQPGKKIDSKLSTPLFDLPFIPPNLPTNPSSLASRNLLRHLTFKVPSGQRVSRVMCIEPLSAADLADLKPLGFDTSTPLWFYILKEAEVCANGETLGPVGGRIVAEVFIGLLEGDRASYLRQDPDWKPTLGQNQDFKMADLLQFAGVV